MIDKTDSYKVSHYLQQPPDMTNSHYYVAARTRYRRLRFFGLQMILKKFFTTVPTRREVAQWADFWKAHGLQLNVADWNYIADLGFYPLRIVAAREGAIVSSEDSLITVEATDPRCAWLPGWIETVLMKVWYPTTVCTRSWECKKEIEHWMKLTGGDLKNMPFKLHDFGYRGVSSEESAGIGGAAHLVNFMGTDTVAGILAAQKYYNTNEMLGFSIPASEHSTITSWGREGEQQAYENMQKNFSREGAVYACVSDSYDLSNAVLNIWGGPLKDRVMNDGATLVIRPDSGDPATVLIRTLKELKSVFGTTINDYGYEMLPDYIRVIQGDGISTRKSICRILERVTKELFCADNVSFGMGGGLLQDLNRDTEKFAMKMSAIRRGKKWYDVYKQPKDAAWKGSKRGRQVIPDAHLAFLDGEINEVDFQTVRGRA